MRWFTRPGEEPPIINWFVMAPAGTILADSYEDPRSVGKDYAFRDYYRGLMAPTRPAERSAVYVSRVYHSEQDGRYKFSIVTRVWDSDRLLGLLGASIATGAKMVALDMAHERPGATVVGPMDRTPRPDGAPPAEEPPEYLAVLHRDYAGAPERPIGVEASRLAALRDVAEHPELAQVTERFAADGCVVDYARVGDSPYVVVVAQPYPWPLNHALQRPAA